MRRAQRGVTLAGPWAATVYPDRTWPPDLPRACHVVLALAAAGRTDRAIRQTWAGMSVRLALVATDDEVAQ